jgi:hypothetical protein
VQRVLSTVTLLGLLVATAAAFAITEHLKLIRSPVYGVLVSTKRISPVCSCADSKATIRIRLRHAGRVTVTIEDAARNTVATLAANRSEPRNRPFHLVWNGRTSGGTVAPDGVYRPEIHLARRTILLPNRITLDTKAPGVLSASVKHRVFFPGAHHTIAIDYTVSEPAHAAVYLGGNRLIRGRRASTRGVVKWAGRGPGGDALPAGRYVLSVGAVDLVGNATPAAERKQVVVHLVYVELAPHVIRVRPGASFSLRVKTAAKQYTWKLAGRHGTAAGTTLRLHAPAKKGRYRLVVTEDGHTAAAIVSVGKR